MSKFIVILSLAAVALARPQVPGTWQQEGGATKVTKVTKITTEGGAATPAWLHQVDSDAKLTAGRSLWNTEEVKTGVATAGVATTGSTWNSGSAWNAGASRVGSGRSAWESEHSAVHLSKDAQPVVEILQQEFENPAPGSYVYSYKTANGIEAKEQAALKSDDAEAVQGVYSWIAPNGEKFAVEYVADETGFHAKGAHIPEIPVAIARSLEWNAAHPEEDGGKVEQGAWKSEHSSSWRSSEQQGASLPAWKSGARSAWVSEHSATIPAWESTSKIESSRTAVPVATGAAWESHSTLPGAKVTKITETRTSTSGLGSSGLFTANSGLIPAGRSAVWGSDSTTGLGGTTKITETRTSTSGLGSSGLFTANAGLVPAGRSAVWGSDSTTGLGGATKITKITETRTVGAPSTLVTGQPSWVSRQL